MDATEGQEPLADLLRRLTLACWQGDAFGPFPHCGEMGPPCRACAGEWFRTAERKAERREAATFLVDRKADGSTREVRGDKDGTGRLASMLFGSRGQEVREVQTLVEELLANGETRERTVNVPAAPTPAAGADDAKAWAARVAARKDAGSATPYMDELLGS